MKIEYIEKPLTVPIQQLKKGETFMEEDSGVVYTVLKYSLYGNKDIFAVDQSHNLYAFDMDTPVIPAIPSPANLIPLSSIEAGEAFEDPWNDQHIKVELETNIFNKNKDDYIYTFNPKLNVVSCYSQLKDTGTNNMKVKPLSAKLILSEVGRDEIS